MKNSKNYVQLEGFAGSDPKIFSLGGDKKMAKLNIAVNDNYKDADGKYKTNWFELIFWSNKLTLVEDIVKKGNKIAIRGSLTTQTYTDKQSQKQVTKTSVIVIHLEIIREESED